MKRLSLFILGTLACLVVFGQAAAADVLDPDVTNTVPATVTLEPWVVAILLGTISPLLAGIAAKLGASRGVKAVVGFAVVALLTVVNVITTSNGTFVVRDTVLLWATTFTMHTASYYGFWKPVGGGASPTMKATPGLGFGGTSGS